MRRLCACLLIASGSLAAQVAWNDTVLALPGRVLSTEVCTLGDNARQELVIGLWNRELRRRELRIHHVEQGRLSAEPRLVIPILEDIVAWGVAELDTDTAGPELLLLTPNSAWSYQVAPGSYANNARKLFDHPLLFDLPDRSSLPRWRHVVPMPGGDQLVLPSSSGYSCWAPVAGDPEGAWAETARFAVDAPSSRGEGGAGDASVQVGRDGIVLSASARAGLDVGQELDGWLSAPLLSVTRSFRAPGLVDMDGDGLLDIVRLARRVVSIHPGRSAGFLATPERDVLLPDLLFDSEVESRDLLLRDVDGDGDTDILALLEGPEIGILDKNHELSLVVLRNTGGGELSDRPQLLRFRGVRLRASVVDVDADGTLDLVADVFITPDLGALTSPDELDATLRISVFRGRGKGEFERSPFVRFEHVVGAANFDQAVQQRELSGDLSGDGLGDLVTSDILGRVGIHPLEKHSSLFGGASWKLPTTPTTRLPTSTGRSDLQLSDLNGDGLHDLISTHESRVIVYLSQLTGASR
ncbi:MAG: hypothetical protein DHS20C15_34020 [Planctomycetota bacterium]|nr:MAG: hypothetical protein DHS20C15_34020 [Planctomycetota bacterium]